MEHTITITDTGLVIVNEWPGRGQLLTHLYEQIGCQLVSKVDLGNRLTMWCDEEAALVEQPSINPTATKLCRLYGPLQSYLLGTVVLTGGADTEHRTSPLSVQAVAVLAKILDTVAALPMPRLD